MIKNILFDLDGTLIDSGPGITNAAAYALSKYNIEEPAETLKYFVGPPLYETFSRFSEIHNVHEAVEHFRVYYKKQGMFECHVYDGIIELLQFLKKSNINIFLATSKPEIFAKQILENYQLTPYFDGIVGSTLDETRTKKADVIEYLMFNYNVKNTKEILMVGDREHDIMGAHHHKIKGIGVLYGYGDKEEMMNCKADYIVETVSDLKSLLERIISC
ncbi:MAG: HAD-IA family hydrolase [Clostridia bacterium]|nr:HAD-IA family hydrolase [Clostridia bacterium]